MLSGAPPIQLPSAHACVRNGSLTIQLHASQASVRVDERPFKTFGKVHGPVRVGGRRKLVIPPALGYGHSGSGPTRRRPSSSTW